MLDLDEKGDLAVRDFFNRTLVFDADGNALYHSFAQFGNFPVQAFFEGDAATRFFDSSGEVSWFVDAKAGAWRPDAHWGYPPGKHRDAVGFFSDSGKQFGVLQFEDMQKHSGVLIVRFEQSRRPARRLLHAGAGRLPASGSGQFRRRNCGSSATTPTTTA